MLTLAIDFDGVIHDYKNPTPGKRMGPPMLGAREALQKFRDEGHTIIIHTVWGDKPKAIEDWMRYYDIPYDIITNVKPNADFFIDDKGIFFQNWEHATKELNDKP